MNQDEKRSWIRNWHWTSCQYARTIGAPRGAIKINITDASQPACTVLAICRGLFYCSRRVSLFICLHRFETIAAAAAATHRIIPRFVVRYDFYIWTQRADNTRPDIYLMCSWRSTRGPINQLYLFHAAWNLHPHAHGQRAHNAANCLVRRTTSTRWISMFVGNCRKLNLSNSICSALVRAGTHNIRFSTEWI